MKQPFIKQAGGALLPASDECAEFMQSFKNDETYLVEIKRCRNVNFHRKVFAFFNFCFEHWCANGTNWELMSDLGQRDVFRKNLTVLAGYYDEYITLSGSIRIEAKSLAFANMDEETFCQCYSALINAALKHVFKTTTDQNIINKLYSFF